MASLPFPAGDTEYVPDPDAEYDAWVDRQANEPPQWWIDQQVEAWEREMQARNDGDHE